MRENLPKPAMARGGPGVVDARSGTRTKTSGSWSSCGSWGRARGPRSHALGGGRNSKQCRERWHNHLDPDVKKGPWSPEEDATIIEQQKVFGNQWARIAEFLPGRTDMSVKNRWHTFVRSAQRKGS